MRFWVHFLATGAFVGYLPRAPGTAGSLLGAGLAWLLHTLPPLAYGVCTLGLFFLGVYVSHQVGRTLGVVDAPQIVLDEIVGTLVALFALPEVFWAWLGGWGLFRALDILKPPPVRWAEALPGGWGVMADDLVAGVGANLGAWALVWILDPGGPVGSG